MDHEVVWDVIANELPGLIERLGMARDSQSVSDRIAASADQVPLHEWQRQLLEERLAAHRAADSNEARPWGEVLDRLAGRLRASSR